MPSSLPSINLTPNKQIPTFDKFMNWALTIGRLIVIVTEVVAVIAFIYRFSLDEKLVELHDEIEKKQNIITIWKNDENKYRNLQDRIALATTFSDKSTKFNETIEDIMVLIPNQIKINNIVLNNDRVNIDVDVASVSALSGLIESLKNYPKTKSISIDSIENKPSIGLSVDIVVMLK